MKFKIIAILSLIVVLGLAGTKILNVQSIEEHGRNADSYHDLSAVSYVVLGLLMLIIAFFAFRLHVVAGILPIGLGIGLLLYGLYICWVKFLI